MIDGVRIMKKTFSGVILILFLILGICLSVNAQGNINVYDFSKVGKVEVYGQQKDISYTVNVNLPDADEIDVPFTIYAAVGGNTYSKQGVIKSGEKSATVEMAGLPVDTRYKTWIEFGYHAYKNAILEDFEFLNVAYAEDFTSDFTARYSRKVVCNVSLPDGFVPTGDVRVKVELSKYKTSGSMVVVNNLTDWSDSQTITLSSENRSEEIVLYSQANSSMLSYKVISRNEGLCQNGYLDNGGKVLSENKKPKEITEDFNVDIKLLQKKTIPVEVYRPFSLSVDNDIFAMVELDDKSTMKYADITMDFTKTPLIPAGERKSQFEFEVAEDKTYTLKIADITGDERLLDYYCYVKAIESPADESKKKHIGFSDESISVPLLQCNNVSGTVMCDDNNLDFDVTASCKLYNGRIIYLTPSADDGKFSFKIPEDTDTYTLSVQTIIGKKSYYVSDGVSTQNEDERTEIFFEYNDDREVVLEYIPYNPALPVEISVGKRYDYFKFENISDYSFGDFNAYVAYYDQNDSLISCEKTDADELISSWYSKIPINTSDYKIRKIKAFAWKKSSLEPLGNAMEVVNAIETPEQNISVFKIGDKKATIHCKEEVLNKAPEKINDTMYITATDFERLGYKVTTGGNKVYIENNRIKFMVIPNEYSAVHVEENNFYDTYELSAPILKTEEILIPLSVLNELFEEKFGWHEVGEICIINMPFYDIQYTDPYCEAILSMYYKGVASGYEGGVFYPTEKITRSEAAVYFSRTMGYEFFGYAFECSDVEYDHWARSWIGICINEGVFGLENNMFRPNDYITVEEAVIAALKMKKINFDNYMDSAKENGLFTNISAENVGRNITRAELMQLLYNTVK